MAKQINTTLAPHREPTKTISAITFETPKTPHKTVPVKNAGRCWAWPMISLKNALKVGTLAILALGGRVYLDRNYAAAASQHLTAGNYRAGFKSIDGIYFSTYKNPLLMDVIHTDPDFAVQKKAFKRIANEHSKFAALKRIDRMQRLDCNEVFSLAKKIPLDEAMEYTIEKCHGILDTATQEKAINRIRHPGKKLNAHLHFYHKQLMNVEDSIGAIVTAKKMPRDQRDEALFQISAFTENLEVRETAADKISTYHYPERNLAWETIKHIYAFRGNTTDVERLDAKIGPQRFWYYTEYVISFLPNFIHHRLFSP